jgi:hypothetical protein
MNKSMIVLIVALCCGCDGRSAITVTEIATATTACENNGGIQYVYPATNNWNGAATCKNGATFYYNKDGVIKPTH